MSRQLFMVATLALFCESCSSTPQTPHPSTPQSGFDGLFEGVEQVRLVEVGGEGDGETLLLEFVGEDVSRLSDLIAVDEDNPTDLCHCGGDLAFDLHRSGEHAARITLHHGEFIRLSGDDRQYRLQDHARLLQWLADRGLAEPQLRYQAHQEELQAIDATHQAWIDAMPPALLSHREELESCTLASCGDAEYDRRIASALQSVRSAYPSAADGATALLEWLGHGEGPWSGYLSHESVAEELLVEFGSQPVLEALSQEPNGDAELTGGARYFTCYPLQMIRPDDQQLVPAELRVVLIEHTRESGLAMNIQIIEAAFGE